MRPSALCGPVATTRPLAVPCVIRVPEYTRLSGLPPASEAPCLMTGTDSPVSMDSSAVKFDALSSSISAGTRSPSASSTRSPSTRSLPAMRCCFPSRITRARGQERSLSAFSERSVRLR